MSWALTFFLITWITVSIGSIVAGLTLLCADPTRTELRVAWFLFLAGLLSLASLMISRAGG